MTAIAFNLDDLMSSCAGMDGVWKRIAGFNITAGDDCPSPWVKSSHNGVSFCRSPNNSRGCYSVNYSTNGIGYQRVCGRASGYQKGSPDGFRIISVVDGHYVDGLSITHGSPRQHIWTYAVGVTDSNSHTDIIPSNCPCATYRGQDPPSFVGMHYYCESGTDLTFNLNTYYVLV